MTLLVLGLIVWTVSHSLRRWAPGARARLDAAVGVGPARGVMAVPILIGTLMVILGYRNAPFVTVYAPEAWAKHVNNGLMVVAVLLLGLGHSKSRLRGALRHPMLIAVVIWAVAHLLVNGDLASLIMFGWFGLWAVGDMLAINARTPEWTPKAPGTVAGDVRWLLISAVVFGAIVTIHTWLGYPPFPA